MHPLTEIDALFQSHHSIPAHTYTRPLPMHTPQHICKNIQQAAFAGHSACVRHFFDNGIPLTAALAAFVAMNGNIPMLGLLHTLSCPIEENALRMALVGGHSQLFRWLHQIGCPWGPDTVLAAVAHNRKYCLVYALNNGCPCDDRAVALAASLKDRQTLKCLITKGAPVPDVTCGVIDELLQELHISEGPAPICVKYLTIFSPEICSIW